MARRFNKTIERYNKMPAYENQYDHLYGPIYGEAFFHYEELTKYETAKCVSWEPYNKHQLKIRLDDGTTVLYNIFDKTVRTLFETDYSDEAFKRDFVYNVDDRLYSKGMTRGQLAKIIGVPAATMSGWMTRKNLPPVGMAMRIARALDCTVEDLFINN